MFVIASASGSGGQDVLFVFSILIVVLCCLAITCYDKFGSSWVCTLLVVNCSKDITPIAGVDAFHSIICLLLAFIQAHFLALENIFTDEYIIYTKQNREPGVFAANASCRQCAGPVYN